jgi:predicted small lipoprotein YifL
MKGAFVSLIIAVPLLLTVGGCGPSEGEVRQEKRR